MATIYIAGFETQDTVDLQHDEPETLSLEQSASPQYSKVTMDFSRDWVEDLKVELEGNIQYGYDSEDNVEVKWTESGWDYPEGKRPTYTILAENMWVEGEVLGMIVIQKMLFV